LLSWIVLSQRTHVHSPILFLRVGFPSPTTEPWTHSEQQQPKAEHKEEEGRDSFQHTCRVIRRCKHWANNCQQHQGTSLPTSHPACVIACADHLCQHANGRSGPISAYANDTYLSSI
ncbi:unnamed protein product, partial [Gadus morhua 'NCC']